MLAIPVSTPRRVPAREARLTQRVLFVVAWLSRALAVARERRALLRLDETALKDIGLSRADAYGEATRRWWDLPAGDDAERR